MTATWPLFDYFPALAAQLQPVPLCSLPTPVVYASPLGEHAWIKRDDISAEEYGGNKMRKMEFVLADMKRRGARHVVTIGATGSNAAVAAALVCQQQGLDFTLITFPQPDSPTVATNKALLEHYGARLETRRSLASAISRWAFNPRRLLPSWYFMYAGCSQPVAVFAYINAALELALQVEKGECPLPRDIVVAAGSGATVAGLSLGAALALPGCTVHAVQVAPSTLGPIDICTEAVVNRFRRDAWRVLRKHAPNLPPLPESNLVWHDNYLGDGYGVNTLKARFAMERAEQCGLSLEQTYTGKAFAAFCDLIAHGEAPALYWNTYSSAPLPDTVTRQLQRDSNRRPDTAAPLIDGSPAA